MSGEPRSAGRCRGRAVTLMVQGTTSDAGKSTLVTGLGRALQRRGLRVAPFKPQNMALNSAVTPEGGEIGRAQALQAQACCVSPHTDMNPVLLKPNSDLGSQVIVQGRVVGNMNARRYHHYKPRAMAAVLASHERLAQQYEAILVEGAGSPAEINLREGDIANMGFAERVDCPVILIADIDKGGVFAHLIGTLELLSPSERKRVLGFVINRFRGDPTLLKPGLDWLQERTGCPVLGVLPYLSGLHLDAEDSLTAERCGLLRDAADIRLRVVMPRLPRISNHTDFDALRLTPGVHWSAVGEGEPVPPADLILLPGSKSVQSDLAWLRRQGWESLIQRHLRYGGKLMGICGGFQMLGRQLHDPLGLEGSPGSTPGLALLDFETTLAAEKQLRNVTGRLISGNARLSGYEIHAGVSFGPALQRPACLVDGRPEGVLSHDDQILGTYLHGLFDEAEAHSALLRWAGGGEMVRVDRAVLREQAIDRLADSVEAHLDWTLLDRWLSIDSLQGRT